MKNYLFGVDVGGTTVKIGLFDKEGNVLDKWEIPTRTANGGEAILPDIAKSIKDKMAEKNLTNDDIIGVGLGAPGPVDNKGIVHKAVNLGWGEFSIKEKLGELLGVQVEAGNDANVAALGEMWKGGGRGYKNVVAVTLGTGVGGGIIVNGEILDGTSGAAGEIGHIHLNDNELTVCGCGNRGCLEQYASATGVVRLAKRRLVADEKPSVLREGELSAKVVFDAVKAGDEVAIDVAKEFGRCLGIGLAIVAAVLNPQIFVVGGGVSKAGPVLFDYIIPAYNDNVFPAARDIKFALAELGNDAGIFGAAKLVLDKAQ
ncbi:MAG: ROK family glucokinase [Lachnospiraceae bacterium]|nr:ROK family glucokinase [Lachnospiraceae bacterium]MBR4993739.1 ROK family glucokinase [Lachnospiraceae bacterium]MBR5943776.1 ROK family glucokinase [Lachnospiraceae bacterium]